MGSTLIRGCCRSNGAAIATPPSGFSNDSCLIPYTFARPFSIASFLPLLKQNEKNIKERKEKDKRRGNIFCPQFFLSALYWISFDYFLCVCLFVVIVVVVVVAEVIFPLSRWTRRHAERKKESRKEKTNPWFLLLQKMNVPGHVIEMR